MAARLTTYIVVGIVAATLIAGLIVGAQRDDSNGPIDLIVHNARVYTADARGTMADAVAIRGNQILRVGSEREVNRLRRPQTTVIDAKRAAVLPGFNDSHVHFLSGGLGLDKVDLADAASVEEIQERIRVWGDANPDRPWVVGQGWTYDLFSDGLPTRQMLDAIVADRPARIVSSDGHASWVNSKALALARITKRTPDPPNGIIVRDARTNEATGVLKETAMSLVDRLRPTETSEERAQALRRAVSEAHRNGITSIQNASGSIDEFELYTNARRTGDLKLRVYSALSLRERVTEPDLDRLDVIANKYNDDPLFKVGAVSIGLDGAVGAHTAAMLEPYANKPSAGSPMMSADDLNRAVRLLDARGWQIMTHAVGDRAIQMALNAYEHAARSNPVPHRGRRHRIEHAELPDVVDLPRFGLLGVIASMQPFRGNPSAGAIDNWSRNIGADRASHGWPYRSIAAARGALAFGSDWPAGSLNPLLGLHAAVNRTTPEGLPEAGWHPEERLGLKAAINAYTSGAAWASFDEQRKGTIAPGMLADLVVLSADIFDTPPSSLAFVEVEVTIFDGKVVYQADRKHTN